MLRHTSAPRIFHPVVDTLACILLLLWASPAPAAQATQGAIVGVITDTSAAILPGVTVTATSPALQIRAITAVTDARGEFRLSPLPPGSVRRHVRAPRLPVGPTRKCAARARVHCDPRSGHESGNRSGDSDGVRSVTAGRRDQSGHQRRYVIRVARNSAH